jgi:hypothetical protein
MSSFGKVVGAIALLAVAAVGLCMSLCGGFFTLAGLTTQGMASILVLSVPSLLGGLVVVWLATRKFRGRVGKSPES